MDDQATEQLTVEKARKVEETATDTFGKAAFKLHRWNSSARERETCEAPKSEGETTFQKEQLGVKPTGNKMEQGRRHLNSQLSAKKRRSD